MYELLNQYLKARLYMRTTEAKLNVRGGGVEWYLLCVIVIQDMKRSYGDSVARVWEIEDKNITSNVREMCVYCDMCVTFTHIVCHA